MSVRLALIFVFALLAQSSQLMSAQVGTWKIYQADDPEFLDRVLAALNADDCGSIVELGGSSIFDTKEPVADRTLIVAGMLLSCEATISISGDGAGGWRRDFERNWGALPPVGASRAFYELSTARVRLALDSYESAFEAAQAAIAALEGLNLDAEPKTLTAVHTQAIAAEAFLVIAETYYQTGRPQFGGRVARGAWGSWYKWSSAEAYWKNLKGAERIYAERLRSDLAARIYTVLQQTGQSDAVILDSLREGVRNAGPYPHAMIALAFQHIDAGDDLGAQLWLDLAAKQPHTKVSERALACAMVSQDALRVANGKLALARTLEARIGDCLINRDRAIWAYRAAKNYDRIDAVKPRGWMGPEITYWVQAVSDRKDLSPTWRRQYFRSPERAFMLDYYMRASAPAPGPTSTDAAFYLLQMSEDVRGLLIGDVDRLGLGFERFPETSERLRRDVGKRTIFVSVMAGKAGLYVVSLDREVLRGAFQPYPSTELAADTDRILGMLADRESDLEQLDGALRRLSSRMLAGFEERLEAKDELIFLVDGTLARIPPTLFYGSETASDPLGLVKRVATAPAVRHVFADRDRRIGDEMERVKQERHAPQLKLVAVGDPAFRSVIAAGEGASKAASRGRIRSVDGGASVSHLPETRLEIEAVARQFADPRIMLGAQSTESALKGLDFTDVTNLHLATHGILGGEIEGLEEPALIMADEWEADTLLTMTEIEKLDLARVSLVILSACNTGSGDYYTGEGTLALSSAFLSAGANRVIASMWPVASDQAVVFMAEYYRNWMNLQKAVNVMPLDEWGMRVEASRDSIATALMLTMREMRDRYEHPFYWAPFVNIGY